MEHDAWLVDLDGTLYHPLPVKLAMAAELLLFGVPSIGALRRFRFEHEAIREELASGDDPYRLQLDRTALALGRDVKELAELVESWMQRRPGRWLRLFRRRALLGDIASFRARGGKTAVVSDYPARHKLEALGVASLFDTVVASGEPGGPRALKPHPGGYLLAAEQLGVTAARCLVIGDRDDADGAAARSAGMQFRPV